VNAENAAIIRISSPLHQPAAFESTNHSSDGWRLDPQLLGQVRLPQAGLSPQRHQEGILTGVEAVGGKEAGLSGTQRTSEGEERFGEAGGRGLGHLGWVKVAQKLADKVNFAATVSANADYSTLD
jgi:hypothetical protein